MNKKNPFETKENPDFDDDKNLSVSMTPFTNRMSSEDAKKVANNAINKEFRQKTKIFWAGVITILIGVVLFILGVNDIINLNLKIGNISAELINASPGVLFVIIGFLLIFSSDVKIKK